MKIYQTMRNSDMTEGRGPMVADLAFTEREYAEDYIDSKPGVMGRRMKWSEQDYGDWTIKEVEVLDYNPIEQERERKRLASQALRKLSIEEREALGIKKESYLK